MRILHFADLHLGVENYGAIDPASGLHSRLLDFLQSFDFLVETAIARQVDLVLFCGDAFRSREPSPTLQYLFAERIIRLAKAGIAVLLLVGNHDLPPLPGRKSSLEIYPILEVPGVAVVTQPELVRLATRSGPIQVACLPAGDWDRPGPAGEKTARELIDELAFAVQVDAPALLAGHISVWGARIGSEGVMGLGREIVLPRDALAREEFRYVALGHVHSFQELNPGSRPPIVYAGSPERVDFSEEHEPKGFVMVELADDGGCSYEFVPTPARRFVTVDLCLEPGAGTLDVLDAIAQRQVAGAVVKVILHSLEEIAIDDGEVRQALSEAAYVLPIAREIERPPARLRAPGLAQGWSDPVAALEEYLKTTRFSEERKAQLRSAAAKLIAGDEPVGPA